jgi:hypothetical protein
MPHVSPTLEGFRAAFRRPSFTVAEIAWRWTVGATACALCLFWAIEYLDTLPVSSGDAALLSTRQPVLAGRAISHILHGSLNRAVGAALLAALALACLWIVAASIGRAATVPVLLGYFREKVADNILHNGDRGDAGGDVAGHVSTEPCTELCTDLCTELCNARESQPLRSLIGLNILRASAMLAALLALIGAAILVSFASTEANPRPGLVFVLFLPLAGLVCFVWLTLNWILSLAGLFAVRDGEDALGAVSSAVSFFRERPGPVFAVGAWTGLAHLTAFTMATTVVSMPLAFIRIAPSRLVIACVILITLIYFAIVDWLYMAQLAGYVCIAEMPEALLSPTPLPAVTPAPVQTTIDRDEPILSDLSNLAMES